MDAASISSAVDEGRRICNFFFLQELKQSILRFVEAGSVALVVNNESRDTKIPRGGKSHVMPLDVAVEVGLARNVKIENIFKEYMCLLLRLLYLS
eukprot:CAMPEP_0201705356 /NCGR_PEP_ID=MMETSP0578-20130828/45576_1 /ASSEMBLY_ACC=CAM_ASM_000663 /TAXON_ID=267565 /ORGANISM="Skeletonema grethea, Strain CCMP 1804" /LENGTH=94 /DNA_ID=CAMNT_0048193581 /DNA_START=70 /DNA_END=354 /DNA_ORIENTATION=+